MDLYYKVRDLRTPSVCLPEIHGCRLEDTTLPPLTCCACHSPGPACQWLRLRSVDLEAVLT